MSANPAGHLRLMQEVERAFDHSDNVVIVLYPAGAEGSELRIADVNGAFCRAFGTTPADAVGRTLTSLADEENDPVLVAAITFAVAARRSLRTEMRCRNGGGGTFWFGMHLMPPNDLGTGEPETGHLGTEECRFVLLGRDITEHKKAGEKQTALQQLLARVFLCVDAAVVITSAEGRTLMTNPRFDRLLGYPPGSQIGRPTGDLIAPTARDAATQAREQAHASGQDYSIDTVGLRHDGSVVAIWLSSAVAHGNEMERFRILTLRERPVDPTAPACRVAGMIKLVGLEVVKEALGLRWPAVEQRATETAEHVIKNSLGAGETYSRSKDGGFVICFANRSEAEASFSAAMIGRRIRERLVGQGEELAALQVTAIAGTVEVVAAEDAGDPINLASLLERRLGARRGACSPRRWRRPAAPWRPCRRATGRAWPRTSRRCRSRHIAPWSSPMAACRRRNRRASIWTRRCLAWQRIGCSRAC